MARNLVRFDPYADIASFADRFLADGFFDGRRRPAVPATDVYTEDDNRLMVETYLPNFAEEDISVNVDRGALVIQAENHKKDEKKNKKYVVRESSTSFYRRIALPELADESAIDAKFDKGVLRVTVPFTSSPNPKKIAINSAPSMAEVKSGPSTAEVGH